MSDPYAAAASGVASRHSDVGWWGEQATRMRDEGNIAYSKKKTLDPWGLLLFSTTSIPLWVPSVAPSLARL